MEKFFRNMAISNLLHHGIFHRPEIVHGESHRYEEKHEKPGTKFSMKAQKDAEAADDGHDARNRHHKTGERNALRGSIGDFLMGKMAEAGYNENQRIEQTPQGDKIAHGVTLRLTFKSAQTKLRSLSHVRPQQQLRFFASPRPSLPLPSPVCPDFPRE